MIESGMSMATAAAGTRGGIVEGGAGGFDVAFKADALWVRDDGRRRVRIRRQRRRDGRDGSPISEGARELARAARGRPHDCSGGIEVGVRQDGGDAENGARMDLSAGSSSTTRGSDSPSTSGSERCSSRRPRASASRASRSPSAAEARAAYCLRNESGGGSRQSDPWPAKRSLVGLSTTRRRRPPAR